MSAVDQEGQTGLSLARAALRANGASELANAQISALVDLLVANGCPEQGPTSMLVNTAVRNNIPPLDKLPASVI